MRLVPLAARVGMSPMADAASQYTAASLAGLTLPLLAKRAVVTPGRTAARPAAVAMRWLLAFDFAAASLPLGRLGDDDHGEATMVGLRWLTAASTGCFRATHVRSLLSQ
jgi:hypothetical protein